MLKLQRREFFGMRTLVTTGNPLDFIRRLSDALDKTEPPLLSSENFPARASADLKPALDRLASRRMVEYETTQRDEVHQE